MLVSVVAAEISARPVLKLEPGCGICRALGGAARQDCSRHQILLSQLHSGVGEVDCKRQQQYADEDQ